jgi:RNA polymerase sigma-70 factor (ECF subfamily)
MLLTRDPDIAKEVVQEAFVRAWQSPKTPRDPGEFRRWLYRIVVNLIRDHQRKQQRRLRFVPLHTPDPDPVAEADRRLSNSTLRQALLQLSPTEREVVYLRFFEDAPFAEVARMLGARQVTIRVRLHRALRKLRKTLRDEENKGDG